MTNYHISLFPDGIYHVLSRAVGDELLFREEENYRFFLQRYIKYISPIADTFAFTLLCPVLRIFNAITGFLLQ